MRRMTWGAIPVFPNGASFVPAKVGLGFQLNGTNQYLVVTNVATTNMIQTQLSLDAWVNPAVPVGTQGVVFAASADGLAPWCTVLMDQAGNMELDFSVTNTTNLVRAPISLPALCSVSRCRSTWPSRQILNWVR